MAVDPAPGVDLEGLEVATECLTQVFKIDRSSIDDQSKPDLLVDLFSSLDPSEKPGFKSNLSRESVSTDGSSTSSTQTVTNNNDLSQVLQFIPLAFFCFVISMMHVLKFMIHLYYGVDICVDCNFNM